MLIVNWSTNLFLFLFLFISFFIENYVLTFCLMSLILTIQVFFNKDLNFRIISCFLLIYFCIPFLNISSYRGNINYETILLYCLSNVLVLIVLFCFSKFKTTNIKFIYVKNNVNVYVIALFHIILAYILVAYLYIRFGNILTNQELRFYISPLIGYLIKSTIYIPLVFIVLKNQRSYFYKISFLILPLIPAFLIGSRGTVIMVIFGLIIISLLMRLEKNNFTNNINVQYEKLKKIHIFSGLFLSVSILYSIFYIRRMASNIYMSSSELLKKYFDISVPVVFIYMILPIYLNLRETVGIANQIITKNLNIDNYIPMFFLELVTILPGKQPSPGILLGELIGKSGDAGLTPGIIGGLYLDFGYYSIIFPALFILIICWFYRRSLLNDKYKVLYALSLIQFFHIYHRGFLKIEYFISFLIVIFYLYLSGFFTIQNESTSRPLSITS